jgi:hypothetical protein
VFFGDGQWDDVEADVGGSVIPLDLQAAHHWFNEIGNRQVFGEMFHVLVARPPISANAVARYLRNMLPASDSAAPYIDSFAALAVYVLHVTFAGSISVVFRDEPAQDASPAVRAITLWIPPCAPSHRRRVGVTAKGHGACIVQLPLDRLLGEYCDFRDLRVPTLSDRDREYLRLMFLWGKDMRSISRAVNLTYQRVQQVVARAAEKMQDDLMAHDSYRVFWQRLRRLCIVTPDVLLGATTEALGERVESVDVAALARFFLQMLKSEGAVKWFRAGRVHLRYCVGTQQQLHEIVAYAQDVRSSRPKNVAESDVSAVCMFILSHSELPASVVRGVAADLLAAVSPPGIADRLEAALAQKGAPCYFAELARCLDDASRGEEVSAEYVHAALERDRRFAWAGLGTYALTAWGYPRETSTLDVVLYMIRTKGSGVTLGEIFEFMFTDRHYELRQSSVRQALKMAEGQQLRRVGTDLWDELEDVQQVSEVIGHE